MDPVQFKLTADAAPILASLDNVADAMKGIQTEYEKTKKAGKELFAPGTEGALKEAEAIDLLQKEFTTLEKSAKALKSALANTTDSRAITKYTTDIAKAEAGLAQLRDVAKKTGVQLKSLDDNADNAGKSVKKLNEAGNTGKEVFEGLVGTITKATIILAVVQAVIEFTKELVTFSATIQKAELQFENFVGSAEKAKETVASLVEFSNTKFLDTQEVLDSAKALLAFGVSGEELEPIMGRIADISAATGKNFQELSIIYGKARGAGVLMAEDINQLVDAGIPIISEFAKQMGVTEGEIKKLASEGKISFERLELAFFDMTVESGKFAGQAEKQAQTLGGAWKKIGDDFLASLKPVGDGISNFLRDVIQGYDITVTILDGLFSGLSFSESVEKANAEVLGNIQKTDREIAYEREEQAEERLRLQVEVDKKEAELNRKKSAESRKEAEKRAKELADIQKQQAQLRANLTADETERQVALEKIKYDALTAELKKYFKAGDELNGLLLKAEQDFTDATNKIRAEALIAQIELQNDLEQQRQEELQAIANASTDKVLALRKEAEEGAKVRRDIALENIAIAKETGEGLIIELKKQGANEGKVKEAQAALDAEIQVARLQAELQYQQELLAITDASDTERVAAINRQIELLGKQISNAAANVEIDPKAGKGFLAKFVESLGLEGEDVAILKDAAAQIVGAINDITAARIADADVALQAAEDRVAAAENALSREIELGEAGFASNVANAQLALDAAKKAEAQALEEKKKAAKVALAIDAGLQISAIATSAAKLFSANATLGPIGIIAAIAQIATMLGVLAGIKSRAKAISSGEFGEGGEAGVDGNSIVTGPSHARGGVGIEVEGGEFMTSDGKRISIVKKKMTKKHFAILKAVNNDNIPEIGRIAAELYESRAGSPRLDTSAGQRVGASVAAGATQRQEAGSLALREQNALLRENNRLLGKIYGKNDGTVKIGNTTVITKGNQTTILRG